MVFHDIPCFICEVWFAHLVIYSIRVENIDSFHTLWIFIFVRKIQLKKSKLNLNYWFRSMIKDHVQTCPNALYFSH